MSFKVKYYDLNESAECVGYYPEVFKKKEIDKENENYIEGEENWNKSIGKKDWFYEVSEEQKQKEHIERAVRRAKTKIRRVAEKYDLKYMWTLTFAKQMTTTYNPANKKTTVYDCSTWEGAWKLFVKFIKDCRSNGLDFNYVVTAEVQEERLLTYGEKVYHFHMATDTYIPQNKIMLLKHNASAKNSNGTKKIMKHALNDFWTFGFTKATSQKTREYCTNYMVKYITKSFEELDLKGKQRYHISNNMEIVYKEMEFESHDDFLRWATLERKIKKGYKNTPLSKYFIIGSDLEIWWIKLDIKGEMKHEESRGNYIC